MTRNQVESKGLGSYDSDWFDAMVFGSGLLAIGGFWICYSIILVARFFP